MRGKDDSDLRIAAFAAAHHAVISRAELRSLGLGDDAIDHRLALGRLHRLYRGVFAVGHTILPREGRWRAAVLACGDGAVLSHFDAAAHLDLLANRGAKIHVTRPTNAGRAPDPRRIALHRVGTLQPDEITVVDGIPTTTTARTLLDVARHLHPTAIEGVIQRAIRLHRSTSSPSVGASTTIRTNLVRRRSGNCCNNSRSATPPTRAATSSGASSCCARASTSAPWPTRASPASRSTSSGRRHGSSSRPTATPSTPRAPPSSAIASAISS